MRARSVASRRVSAWRSACSSGSAGVGIALAKGGASGGDHAGAQLLQLGDPRREVGAVLRRQLEQRGAVRLLELERGVHEAALVEVEAGAQRELLAQQRRFARAQQRGETLLRAQRRRAPSAASDAR